MKGVNSACVFCPLSPVFKFVGDKIATDRFYDEITPSLKANHRLKLYPDVATNNLR